MLEHRGRGGRGDASSDIRGQVADQENDGCDKPSDTRGSNRCATIFIPRIPPREGELLLPRPCCHPCSLGDYENFSITS